MTAGSSSEAWRSASEPKAGTSGRSPGAQATRGTRAKTRKNSSQEPFLPGGKSWPTPRANSFLHSFICIFCVRACAGPLGRQRALDAFGNRSQFFYTKLNSFDQAFSVSSPHQHHVEGS